MGRIAAPNWKLRRIVEFLDLLAVRFKGVLPNLGLYKPRSINQVLPNLNKKTEKNHCLCSFSTSSPKTWLCGFQPSSLFHLSLLSPAAVLSPGLSDSIFLVCFSFCLLFCDKRVGQCWSLNDYDFNLNNLYLKSRCFVLGVGTAVL